MDALRLKLLDQRGYQPLRNSKVGLNKVPFTRFIVFLPLGRHVDRLWDYDKETKGAAALQRIMKGKHAKTGPTLYNEITNRNAAAKIAQLRTGHCGLNRYLHRFGIKDTPYYKCGYRKETVKNYLIECRNYTNWGVASIISSV